MQVSDILLLIVIGLSAGLVGGSLGVGGGIVIVPALMFLFGYSQHQAQGTSLAFMLPPLEYLRPTIIIRKDMLILKLL